MKTNKKLSVAILAWLTKVNYLRLSLAKSLKSQMSFGSAIIFYWRLANGYSGIDFGFDPTNFMLRLT